MSKKIDSVNVRKMSPDELLEELALEEDMDDVIQAELQRRTLAQLGVISWALLAIMGMALVGLVIVGLYIADVLGRAPDRGWSLRAPSWL